MALIPFPVRLALSMSSAAAFSMMVEVGLRTSISTVSVPRKVLASMSGARWAMYSTGMTSLGSLPGVLSNEYGASAWAPMAAMASAVAPNAWNRLMDFSPFSLILLSSGAALA